MAIPDSMYEFCFAKCFIESFYLGIPLFAEVMGGFFTNILKQEDLDFLFWIACFGLHNTNKQNKLNGFKSILYFGVVFVAESSN